MMKLVVCLAAITMHAEAIRLHTFEQPARDPAAVKEPKDDTRPPVPEMTIVAESDKIKTSRKISVKFIKSLAILASIWHPESSSHKKQVKKNKDCGESCRGFDYKPEKSCNLTVGKFACIHKWNKWEDWERVYDHSHPSTSPYHPAPLPNPDIRFKDMFLPGEDDVVLYRYKGTENLDVPELPSTEDASGICVLAFHYVNDFVDVHHDGFIHPDARRITQHFGCDPKDYDSAVGWTSKGFNAEKHSLFDDIPETRKLQRTIESSCHKGVWVTAYSMGGALAEMVAQCPYVVPPLEPRSPPQRWDSIFGNAEFKGLYTFEANGPFFNADTNIFPHLKDTLAGLSNAKRQPKCLPGWRTVVSGDMADTLEFYLSGLGHSPMRVLEMQTKHEASLGGNNYLFPRSGLCAVDSVPLADQLKFYMKNPKHGVAMMKALTEEKGKRKVSDMNFHDYLPHVMRHLDDGTNPDIGKVDGRWFNCEPLPDVPGTGDCEQR